MNNAFLPPVERRSGPAGSARPDPEDGSPLPSRPGPTRVLVVDDTPALLDLVRETLEGAGYEVFTCLQGRDALAMARREQPHVLMLDLVMPEVSGWEVLEGLRGDPALGPIPVVICTAYAAEALGRLDELQKLMGNRHLGLLPKPFDLDELLEVIGSVTGGPSGRYARSAASGET